jgi:hypothetical protein
MATKRVSGNHMSDDWLDHVRTSKRRTRYVSYGRLVLLFLSGIAVFGILYWLLSLGGWALQPVFPTGQTWKLGFGDCLYFSFATATSLGYGDLRPTGWVRALAGAEVVFGLVILALFVSQVTSARFGYLLSGVYQNAVRARLQYWRGVFEEFSKTVELAGETQGHQMPSSRAISNAVSALGEALRLFRLYVQKEQRAGDFFTEASDASLREAFASMLEAVKSLDALCELTKGNAASRRLLARKNRVSNVLSDARFLSDMAVRLSEDVGLNAICDQIGPVCDRLEKHVCPA